MKRITAIFISILILIFSVQVVFAQNDPTFSASKVDGIIGETVTVDITTANNSGIVSLKLQVGYDANVLQLTEIIGVDFANASFGPLTNNPIAVNWVDTLNGNNTTNGVVARLTFNVLQTATEGETEITLTYDPEDVYDNNFDNVTFAIKNGSVNVQAKQESDTDSDSDSDTNTSSETDSDTNIDTGKDTESDTDTSTSTDSDTDKTTDTDTSSGKTTDTDTSTQTDVDTGSDTDTSTDTEVKNGIVDGYYYENGVIIKGAGIVQVDGDYYNIGANGQVFVGTVPVSAAKTNGLIPAGTYTFGEDGKLIIESETDTDTDTSTDTGADTDTQTDTETDTAVESDTDTDTETDSVADDTETDTDVDTKESGDINQDGILDIIDVAMARAHIVGNKILDDAAQQSGDMNGDGILDIIDVVMMRKAIVG